MSKNRAKSSLLIAILSVIIVSSWAPLSNCLKKPAGAARKEDVPYIKCQVCEKLAKELYNLVQKKQDQISPKKISEYLIIEIVENVCNLKKEEADWMLKIDIVEQGDKLQLVDQDVEGHCNSECKTIERTCQEVIGYSDTDVAEYLYKNKPELDSLMNYLCKGLTKSCSRKPPPVPKDRTPGEPFVPKPTKEAEMDKILKSMEGMPGAPSMKMYSRDELMNMQNLGDDDEDEDEDDDDANFKSNLKKAVEKKESGKAEWKEKIVNHVVTAGKTVKKHANRVSHRLRQWWRSKMNTGSKKKSTGKKAEL